MQINWFTVIAQVINFLILVWLLKRYLYKPVLQAIDIREKKIVAQLNEAQNKMAVAQKEGDEFQKRNEVFDQERKEHMNKVIEEVKLEKQKLLEEARNESIALRSRLEAGYKDQQQNLNDEIRRKTQLEVFAIAGKTLTDLASLSLEKQSVDIFIERLHLLKDEGKKQFSAALNSFDHTLVVKSAFVLPEVQRSDIEKAVNEIIDDEISFRYETAPELVSGIEISTNGYKLTWNIAAYLASLEKNVTVLLSEKNKGEKENVA